MYVHVPYRPLVVGVSRGMVNLAAMIELTSVFFRIPLYSKMVAMYTELYDVLQNKQIVD